MTKVIEKVTFKLIESIGENDFITANNKLNDWIQSQPGFINRSLSQGENGIWMDIVTWSSMTDAKNAGEKIMTELDGSDCLRMIDPDSVQISHNLERINC